MQGLDDISCQQILADPERWKNVASKVKEDWVRCFSELQNLETLLEEDQNKRIVWAGRLKVFGFLLSGLQNIVAGVAAFLPLSKINSPNLSYALSGITFALSLTLWSQLNSRSHKFLIVAKDIERLKILCKNVRKILKEAIDDGRISETERNLIRDMIGEMHKKSSEIGSLSLLMKIFSNEGGSTNKSSSYQEAFDGMNSIIEEIKNSNKEISVRLPDAVKEYNDSQLSSQMYAVGMQHPGQLSGRQPEPHPVVQQMQQIYEGSEHHV